MNFCKAIYYLIHGKEYRKAHLKILAFFKAIYLDEDEAVRKYYSFLGSKRNFNLIKISFDEIKSLVKDYFRLQNEAIPKVKPLFPEGGLASFSPQPQPILIEILDASEVWEEKFKVLKKIEVVSNWTIDAILFMNSFEKAYAVL